MCMLGTVVGLFFLISEFNDAIDYNLWLFMEVWVKLMKK